MTKTIKSNVMLKKHKYFTECTYDKMYTQLKRSRLDWKAKALISHIINWQEKNDKKTGKQLICTQSNVTIANELGMSESTLNKLITRLGKLKPKFFKAEAKPKTKPDGGYSNGTRKIVDMNLLIQFLNAEEKVKKIETETVANVMNEVIIEPPQPSTEIHSQIIKDRISKEKAFEQIGDKLLKLDCAVFGVDEETINTKLKQAIMSRLDLPDGLKIAYCEWVSDFISEDYSEMKKGYLETLSRAATTLIQ